MYDVALHPTKCAICNTYANATELYSANFDLQALNPEIFSARRLPDRVHYRIVKCDSCGLVRSDPVADPEIIAQLYSKSSFDYSEEITNLKDTYVQYLAKLDDYGVHKGALLEIGCGNGFFLEEALRHGFAKVHGVEPSFSAIERSHANIRPHIVCDIMRAGLFGPEQFDVVCMFQTLDHIPDPGPLLDECFRVLKPGGFVLCLNHNIGAVSARLLKERSPIIDIEHTYLFNTPTISNIMTAHGFKVKSVGSVLNIYSLYYLIRLFPGPSAPKSWILSFLSGNFVGRVRLSVPLGNLYLIAQKSEKSL